MLLVSRGSKVGIRWRFDWARGTAPQARESGRNDTAASCWPGTVHGVRTASLRQGSCIVPIHADSLTAAAADYTPPLIVTHGAGRGSLPSIETSESRLLRYQYKGCGRTFNALTGTPLSGLHHKERWLSFGASLAKGETVKASAARCDVAVSTAFRWRHRFLAAARSDSEVLKGIVEADETYVLESRKGARGLGRKARRRGGKAKKRGLSREQVPVLMATGRRGTTVSVVPPRVDAATLAAALDPVVAKDALLVFDGGASYPPCAAVLGVSRETLNRSMGERVRGDLYVQTMNSSHSRLKDFLRPCRGIATRYLDNYLSWFHLVGLARGANDRVCLAAAIAKVTHTIHELGLFYAPPRLAERSADPAWRSLRCRYSAPISSTVAKTTKEFDDSIQGVCV